MTCRPFSSFLELDEWRANDEFNQCKILLDYREREAKVLVCHDYKNGYQEDANAQGSGNNQLYTLTKYWSFIDIFVYFSHHTITIPPVGWINAAHKNNVLVLGTVITEGKHGQLENLLMIFGNLKSCSFARKYADILVEMAVYYNFDGWFLNLESELPQMYISYLIQFLDYLTRRMHQRKPGSRIIWYDALTLQGKVDWQDKLTLENKQFFDVVDGIFINYTWKSTFPSESAALAGKRNYDVFTGIDFWGRGQFGGGGFNVHKAIREIKKAKTSMAFFAPAWTWEFLGQESFDINEARLWTDSSIIPVLPKVTKIPSTWPDLNDLGCISEYLDARPISNFFSTFFNIGYGSKYFINGIKVSDYSWSHLGRSDILSNFFKPCCQISCEDSFHGGSCIEISLDKPDIKSGDIYNENHAQLVYLLFSTDLNIEEGLHIELFSKSKSGDIKVGLFNIIENSNGKESSIFHNQVNVNESWTKMELMIESPTLKKLKAVGLYVSDQNYTSCDLLQIGMFRISSSKVTPEIIRNENISISISEKSYDEASERYSFVISWIPTAASFYELYINNIWVGTSFQSKYRVSLSIKDMENILIRISGYGMNGDLMLNLDGAVRF